MLPVGVQRDHDLSLVGECGAEALEQCGSERVAVERDQAEGEAEAIGEVER